MLRMKPKSHSPARRRPKQRRARETVEAILDAVTKILKREGSQALTTNRIADVAGVSIGSLYQYFPDKRAIFIALHRRHIEQMDRLVERTDPRILRSASTEHSGWPSPPKDAQDLRMSSIKQRSLWRT